MTDSPLEPLDLLDTDYADILASSHPWFNYNWRGLTHQKPASKPISSPAVRQKPETPEQWATLTEAWEVACEYKPTVEDFRLLAEFLWENQDSVEVD